MSEMPHYGIVTIDEPTLRSTQHEVKNIQDYEFSGRTAVVFAMRRLGLARQFIKNELRDSVHGRYEI